MWKDYKKVYFKTEKMAKKYQNKYKGTYGCKPSLFLRVDPKPIQFFIIKPRGLTKIK